jgi:lipopolysaccharide transport system ATP-binding protein
MSEVLVKVEGISKKFCRSLKRSLWYGLQDLGSELAGRAHYNNAGLREDEFWAIQDVSFELKRGECLGLVGRNGAGKTTLLRMLNGLIRPDQGRIEIRGRVGALISLGAGFNPVLTGRENIYINSAVLGLNKQETDANIDNIIDFSELHDFIDMPVQSYSSGMVIRLGFSIATTIEPDVLFLDEVLAVGDAGFKAKCFNRIGRLLNKCAVVFVTHSMHQLYRIADGVMVLNEGSPSGILPPHEAIRIYDTLCANGTESAALYKDGAIADATLTVPAAVRAGDDFPAKITLLACRPVVIGQVILNLTDVRTGTLAAEYRRTNLNRSVEANIPHDIGFSIGPVFLRTGQYSVSCAVFDANGMINLAHFTYYATIEIANPVPTEAICGY